MSFAVASAKPRSIMIIGFAIALLLTVLPLPFWAAWLRPEWTLLLLLAGVYRLPETVGVLSAFVLGLCLDGLYNSVLGVHGLALILTTTAALLMQRSMRVHGLLVQMMMILFLAIGYQCSLLVLGALLKQQIPYFWVYWAPAVTLTLLWPWVVMLIDVKVGRR